ncbi:MAG: hypothetical protein BWY21_01394 [Parcubacteria group bacterium ADurb.Bin216]|nr:MAG: hypothetical protein BWY21_01394 [Parcubacteria group bacterium ADurb.Bin216]
MKSKICYSVIKPNKKAPLLTKIKMTGIESEITLVDVQGAINQNEKAIRELEANMKIQEAKMKNVEEHHPEVKDIKEITRQACYLYQESFSFCKVAKEKLKDLKNANKEMHEQVKEIEKQTGLCLK